MNLLPLELPTLETPRLRLRPMTPADVDNLFAIYGDPEVMRYASDDPFPERETVFIMLASDRELFLQGESLEWGIEEKATCRLVGTVGLHSFDFAAASAEAGCMLERAAWGRGIMAEALREISDYAKETLLLTRLRADIDALNARSIRLFTRMGFRHQRGTHYERSL